MSTTHMKPVAVRSVFTDAEARGYLHTAFEQGTGALVAYLGWNKWQALYGFVRDQRGALYGDTFKEWRSMGGWVDVTKLELAAGYSLHHQPT